MPDQNRPKPPQRELNDLGDQRQIERASRGGWRWWWIWPVVIALVVWWASSGWGNHGERWWGLERAHHEATPVAPAANASGTQANAGGQQSPPSTEALARKLQMTGPGVQVLAAQDKHPFIGKQFQVQDVPVQRVINDHAMWIGAVNSEPMLAVMNPKLIQKYADSGDVVDAQGTIEKAPSEARAESQWSLPDADARRLEQEGAYIQVSQLTVPVK